MTTTVSPEHDPDTRIRGNVYRDPEIFREEIDKIWNRTWVFLGHESEIPRKGDFRRRNIGTQPVIMVRGSDEKIRVFYNRCRHRGSLLCHQERGHAARFVCPYHSWTYSNTGPLIAPAYREGLGPDFNKEDFPLVEVGRVDFYRGLIFASIAAEGQSLDEHLGMAKDYLNMVLDASPEGEIRMDAGDQKVRYYGNWKFLPENTMEGDHHGGVIHKIAFNLFSKRSGFNIGAPLEGNHEVILSLPGGHMVEDYRAIKLAMPEGWRPSEARQAYAGALAAARGPEKARELLTTLPPLFYIFPNLLFVTSHFRRIEPVSPGETVVHYTPVQLLGVPDEVNEGRLREQEFGAGSAGFITPDDIEIMERNQMAMDATGDDWLFIGRGRHREVTYPNGTTGGQSMDENHLRAFWRHYAKVMEA